MLLTFVGIGVAHAVRKPPKALPPGGGPADRVEGVRRMLKHLVRGSVATLSDGTAAVLHGRAEGTPALLSPNSWTPCIGFHLSIRTLTFESTLLYDQARCGDFTLADAS